MPYRTRRPHRALAAALVAGVCWLAVGPPAAAQQGDAVDWRQAAAGIEADLLDGKWARALRTSRSTLRDLIDTLPGAREDAEPLARLLTLRAVAAARLRDDEESRWSWAVAQSLDPSATGADLDRFGRGGRVLTDDPLRERAPDGQIAGEAPVAVDNLFAAPTSLAVEVPRPTRNPDPDYPAAARAAGVGGPVILQVMIDRHGRPYNPLVLESPSPVLAAAAAEAVRDWRFRPARVDGREVAVVFNLRLDFRP
jgi:TonB family protein